MTDSPAPWKTAIITDHVVVEIHEYMCLIEGMRKEEQDEYSYELWWHGNRLHSKTHPRLTVKEKIDYIQSHPNPKNGWQVHNTKPQESPQ